MYRVLYLKYGVWDQLRVDYGNELMNMFYFKHKLKFRYNTTRRLFFQTTPRMESIIIFNLIFKIKFNKI